MKTKLWVIALPVTLRLIWHADFATAQTGTETDPRFEKLATELYPKAKPEGGLVVYTTLEVETIRSILASFTKRFPGISTNYWTGTRSELITRALNEFQDNQASVDIVLGESAPLVLRSAGAIQSYRTVQEGSLILHNPEQPIYGLQIQALAYNTKKLKTADLPKSWEDVVNPKYKGMVALDDPMRAGPLSGLLVGLKDAWNDNARWTRFIRGLKALDVPLHKSTSAMFRLLIAGEYSIAMPSLVHDVINEKEKGSPVDFVKGAGPVISPQHAALYAKAPHVNTAKLFAEWMISPDGQVAVDAGNRPGNRKGFKSKVSIGTWGSNVKPIPITDKLFYEDPRKWLDTNVKPVWEN